MVMTRLIRSQSQEVTCFSYDDQHKYRWDDSSLRYYYPPSLPADLNRGFDTFRQLDDTRDDHLDGLVDTIALYEKEKGVKADADIVTWRGMMTKVCSCHFGEGLTYLRAASRLWRHHSRSWRGLHGLCFRPKTCADTRKLGDERDMLSGMFLFTFIVTMRKETCLLSVHVLSNMITPMVYAVDFCFSYGV
jgi:hypothetical protein